MNGERELAEQFPHAALYRGFGPFRLVVEVVAPTDVVVEGTVLLVVDVGEVRNGPATS